jgi:CRISPR-associated endonuclease Csn1
MNSARNETRTTVDAVVVGVTENEHLQKLARSKYSVMGEQFELPWQDFREEVRENVKQINVSHRAHRKASGALHKETNYGPTNTEGRYVFRKNLEDLTLPMVKDIVDDVVRHIVRGRLKEKGIDIEGGARKIPKEIWKEPLYMKTTKSKKQVPIKKVRVYNVAKNVIPIKDSSGQPYRYVEPGDNHHVEIIEYTNEKGITKREGNVVSLFEATQRLRQRIPVIQKDHGQNKKFICSLAKSEMFMFEVDETNKKLCRVQEIWESGNIVLRPHTNVTECEDINKTASRLKGCKVTVDPLGKILPAND